MVKNGGVLTCIRVFNIENKTWRDWFLCFIIFNMFLDVWNSTVLLFYFKCMRDDTEFFLKNFSIEPISANPRIVLCSVVYRRATVQVETWYYISLWETSGQTCQTCSLIQVDHCISAVTIYKIYLEHLIKVS